MSRRPPIPGSPPSGNRTPPERVRAMFDRIAPVYDGMNTLMTAGLDARWRRAAVAAAGLGAGDRVVDVACGTGRLTEALAAVVGPGGEVIGVDRSREMLRRARARLERETARDPDRRRGRVTYLEADALRLPVADGSVDAATIAFGLRNLPDYRAALVEMARVVRPDGRVVVLEIAVPDDGGWTLVFRWWFRRLVPLLGRLAGGRGAYGYLPASLLAYPDPRQVAGLMRAAGLAEVRWRRLASGMATVHVGRKPA